MKYMLDTDTCITLIRQRAPRLLEKVVSFLPGELGLSIITVAELHYGVEHSQYRDKNRAALTQFLLPFDIADFDHTAALTYGSVRAELEAKGLPIGAMDTLIAAHALALKVTLVTHNLSEFQRVPGLGVEDWY
jgi:tRNA(fMet)-specific endonuclease VapC